MAANGEIDHLEFIEQSDDDPHIWEVQITFNGKNQKIKGTAVKLPADYDAEFIRKYHTLDHPNILRCYETWDRDNDTYAVVEHVPSRTVGDYLTQLKSSGTTLGMVRIYDWAKILIGAIAFLHERDIVLRIVNSRQIFLTEDMCLKLNIVELAKTMEGDKSTKHRKKASDVGYLPPEVIQDQTRSLLSDIFSFGVVVWQFITGEVPYGGEKDYEVMKAVVCGGKRLKIPEDCPEKLADLLRRCWLEDHKQRPEAREVLQIVNEAQQEYMQTSTDIIEEAYQNAMNKRMTKKSACLVIIGTPGSGKTTLARKLANEWATNNGTGTDDVDYFPSNSWINVCNIRKTDQHSKGTCCTHQGACSDIIAENLLENLSTELKSDPTQQQVFNTWGTSKIPSLVKVSMEKLRHQERSEAAGNFVIWDFAGQQTYRTNHQMFFSRKAVFVMVFNLDDDILPSGSKENTDLFCTLASLCDLMMTSQPSVQFTSRIILVGTHMDIVPKTKVTETFQSIQDFLQDKYMKSCIHNEFFAIGNTSDNQDEQFVKVETCIMEEMKVQWTCEEEIPLKWVMFEETLAEAFNNGRSILTAIEVQQLCRERYYMVDVTEEELSSVLQYLHTMGNVVFAPYKSSASEKLVLDPSWLIGVFIKLMTVPENKLQNDKCVDAWARLETTGIMEDGLIEHLLKEMEISHHKSTLLEILEESDLLYSYEKNHESSSYWIPSKLPFTRPSDKELCNNKAAVKFDIDFHGFLPVRHFHELAIIIVHWSKEQNKNLTREPKLYYHALICMVDRHHEVTLLISAPGEAAIKVCIAYIHGKEEDGKEEPPSSLVFKKVLQFLKQAVEEMTSSLTKKAIPATFCIECGCGAGQLHYLDLESCLTQEDNKCSMGRSVNTREMCEWYSKGTQQLETTSDSEDESEDSLECDSAVARPMVPAAAAVESDGKLEAHSGVAVIESDSDDSLECDSAVAKPMAPSAAAAAAAVASEGKLESNSAAAAIESESDESLECDSAMARPMIPATAAAVASEGRLECDSVVIKSMTPVATPGEMMPTKGKSAIQSVDIIHEGNAKMSGARKKIFSTKSPITQDQTKVSTTSPAKPKPPVRGKPTKAAPDGVKIVMVDQPRSAGLRFGSDTSPNPPASSKLKGQNSIVGKETAVTFCLTNYTGPVCFIAWLSTEDGPHHPHPHKLVGSSCREGVFRLHTYLESPAQMIRLRDVFIIGVQRGGVSEELDQRTSELKRLCPTMEFETNKASEYDLSRVMLCIMGYISDANFNIPVLPKTTVCLYDRGSLIGKEPRILYLTETKGPVIGGHVVKIVVARLQSGEATVIFTLNTTNPPSSWQNFATVKETTRVKSNVLLTVSTPAFYNKEIRSPVTVKVQVRRSDEAYSNAIAYTFLPSKDDSVDITKKVNLRRPIYQGHFLCVGAARRQVLEWDEKEFKMGKRKKENDEPWTMEQITGTTENLLSVIKRLPQVIPSRPLPAPKQKSNGASGGRQDMPKDGNVASSDSEQLRKYKAFAMSHGYKKTVKRIVEYEKVYKDGASGSVDDEDHLPPPASEARKEQDIHDWVSSTLQGAADVASGSSKSISESKTDDSELKTIRAIADGSASNVMMKSDEEAANQDASSAMITEEGEEPDINLAVPSLDDKVYRWNDKIGEGSYGAVFRVEVTNMEHLVVFEVKEVTARKIDAKSTSKKFLRDLVRLSDPNVVRVYGILHHEQNVFMAMEYMQNGCLESYLSDFSIPSMKLKSFAIQAASGLCHLHDKGFVHGNVSPKSYYVSADDTVKLRILSPGQKKTTEDDVLAYGTVLSSMFVVPQIYQQDETTSSIGFQNWNMVNRNKQLHEISQLCWQKDPKARPPMTQVIKDLEQIKLHATEDDSVTESSSFGSESLQRSNTTTTSYLSVASSPSTTRSTCTREDSGYCQSSSVSSILRQDPAVQKSPNLTPIHSSRGSECGSNDRSLTESPNSFPTTLGMHQGEMEMSPKASAISSSLVGRLEIDSGMPADSSNQRPHSLPEVLRMDDDSNKKSLPEFHSAGSSFMKPEDAAMPTQGEKSREDDKDMEEDKKRDEDAIQQNQSIDVGKPSPLKVEMVVDHQGGIIKLEEYNISLTIPEGALPEGVRESISLAVIWDDVVEEMAERGCCNIAPPVRCLPTGLRFLKPVTLRIPHCAVLDDNRTFKSEVFCNENDEDQKPDWKTAAVERGYPKTLIHRDHILLQVMHFTDYIINIDGVEHKRMRMVVYVSAVESVNDEQDIRVYIHNDHKTAQEKVEAEEQNGGIKKLPTDQVFYENTKHPMQVKLAHFTHGWALIYGELVQTIPFKKMWYSDMVSNHFLLDNKADVEKFFCKIQAHQHNNDLGAEIQIANHVSQVRAQTAQEVENTPPGKMNAVGLYTRRAVSQTNMSIDSGHALNSYSSEQQELVLATRSNSVSPPDPVQSLTSQLSETYIHPSQLSHSVSYPSASSTDLAILASQAGSQSAMALPMDRAPCGPRGMPGYFCIPWSVQSELCKKLNPWHPTGDWHALAGSFNYNAEDVAYFEHQADPTRALLTCIKTKRLVSNLQELAEKLRCIDRIDAVEVIEHHLQSQSESTSPESTNTRDSSFSSCETSPKETPKEIGTSEDARRNLALQFKAEQQETPSSSESQIGGRTIYTPTPAPTPQPSVKSTGTNTPKATQRLASGDSLNSESRNNGDSLNAQPRNSGDSLNAQPRNRGDSLNTQSRNSDESGRNAPSNGPTNVQPEEYQSSGSELEVDGITDNASSAQNNQTFDNTDDIVEL